METETNKAFNDEVQDNSLEKAQSKFREERMDSFHEKLNCMKIKDNLDKEEISEEKQIKENNFNSI